MVHLFGPWLEMIGILRILSLKATLCKCYFTCFDIGRFSSSSDRTNHTTVKQLICNICGSLSTVHINLFCDTEIKSKYINIWESRLTDRNFPRFAPRSLRFDLVLALMCIWFPVQIYFHRFSSGHSSFSPASKTESKRSKICSGALLGSNDTHWVRLPFLNMAYLSIYISAFPHATFCWNLQIWPYLYAEIHDHLWFYSNIIRLKFEHSYFVVLVWLWICDF